MYVAMCRLPYDSYNVHNDDDYLVFFVFLRCSESTHSYDSCVL